MFHFLFIILLNLSYGFKSNRLSKSQISTKKYLLPSDELKAAGISNIGVPWSYTDLFENSKNNIVKSLSILEDGTRAIAVEQIDPHTTRAHIVDIIPDNVNNLLDHMLKYNVNVDVFQNPKNEFIEIVSRCGEAVFTVSIYLLAFTLVVNIFLAIRNLDINIKNDSLFDNTPFAPMQTDNINLFINNELNTTFRDVAGCEESKFELMEVVDFLKHKDKYEEAGAKIPKGVLLEGPPGTGKTLLARAVAGEAQVPFFSISGSEFIEIFVGVGASRVRKLFEKARKNQPCVIFIDEIDAIGRKRGAGVAGGNDEREQTLNQILTNMDGFSPNQGIVVIAATNRIDILDQALTRPGRFDRKVQVGLPDYEGRKEIMKVYFGNKKIDNTIDFNELSSLTPGFSGADIANLANEAAIFSVRKNADKITRAHTMDAYEKITIGLVSTIQTADAHVIELVSAHEIGHALMVAIFKDMFDLRKVTINENKSGAGGYTLFTPKERFQKYPTKKFMLANLIIAFGGRAAETYLYRKTETEKEEEIFRLFTDLEITTGASNDLKQASSIARSYITDYGFGEFIGNQEDTYNSETPFMGRDYGIDPKKVSENTVFNIDMQVNMLLEFAFNQSYTLIEKKHIVFEKSVDMLKEKRIISGKDLYDLL
jgi:cell division protease FtsH|uniref:AAA+ ATPase domain-containing protein n=1 Tax=viral metagenome TaxID=1070528 RepID=A0A6C0INH6_9ZZZZ